MAKTADFTLSDILQRINRARKFSAGWHENVERWRDLYNFKHYSTKAKTGEQRYVDSTPTNGVDLAVGILQSNDYIWKAVGWSPTIQSIKDTSHIEKAISAFIDINTDRSETNLKYEINLNFVRDGGACLYGVWDKATHEGNQEQRDLLDKNGDPVSAKVLTELPLRIEAVDVMKMLVMPGGPNRWQTTARVDKMSVADVEGLYEVDITAHKHRTKSEKIDIMGELIDYWDIAIETMAEELTEEAIVSSKKRLVVRNAIIFDNQILKPLEIKDGYKDVPYTLGFYNPTSRTESKGWSSFIRPLEEQVKDLEQTTNMRKRLMLVYSNMPMISRTRSNKPITVDPAIGKVIPLGEGDDLGFPQWQGTPPDVDKHLEFLRSRIQQSGFSDVMYGSGASAVSGYAMSQLGDQNRIRLIPAIAHLEDLWTRSARKWINLATEFAPDLYMELYGQLRGQYFATMVKGEDLQGYKVRCMIKPEFPNERTRQHALASQISNILPATTIIEDYLNYQQPDDQHAMKLEEMIESNPVTIRYAMMKKLQERAKAGDEAAQILWEQLKNEAAPPTNEGGRPKEPSNPPQLTGTQSPNGQPLPTPSPEQAEVSGIEMQANAAPNMGGGIFPNG